MFVENTNKHGHYSIMLATYSQWSKKIKLYVLYFSVSLRLFRKIFLINKKVRVNTKGKWEQYVLQNRNSLLLNDFQQDCQDNSIVKEKSF